MNECSLTLHFTTIFISSGLPNFDNTQVGLQEFPSAKLPRLKIIVCKIKEEKNEKNNLRIDNKDHCTHSLGALGVTRACRQHITHLGKYFVLIWCAHLLVIKTKNEWLLQCTMDPTYLAGFQQQPAPGTVETMYPPPLPLPPGVLNLLQAICCLHLCPLVPLCSNKTCLTHHRVISICHIKDGDCMVHHIFPLVPMPNVTIPPHASGSGVAGPATVTPIRAPPAPRQYMNFQQEPGGK